MEYENDFMVKVSFIAIDHLEEYMGYQIKIIQTKVLKNKEIRPIHDPICPPLGANGR